MYRKTKKRNLFWKSPGFGRHKGQRADMIFFTIIANYWKEELNHRFFSPCVYCVSQERNKTKSLMVRNGSINLLGFHFQTQYLYFVCRVPSISFFLPSAYFGDSYKIYKTSSSDKARKRLSGGLKVSGRNCWHRPGERIVNTMASEFGILTVLRAFSTGRTLICRCSE